MCIVKDNTFNEEIRRKEDGISSHSETLVTEKQGMSKSRKPPNNNSHDNSRGRSASRKGIKCFRCGELGHMKNCARSLKRTIRKRKKREEKKEEEELQTMNKSEHIGRKGLSGHGLFQPQKLAQGVRLSSHL